MNANELLFYLRGFFELVNEPTQAHIQAIRNEVLHAEPVPLQLRGGCGGCGGKGSTPGVSPGVPPRTQPPMFSQKEELLADSIDTLKF